MARLVSRGRTIGVGLACFTAAAIVFIAIAVHAGAAAPNPTDHFAVLASTANVSDSDMFASPIAKKMASLNRASAPDPAAARTRLAIVIGAPGVSREVSVTTGTNGRVCLGHQSSAESAGALFINCAPAGSIAKTGLFSVSHPTPGPDVDPAEADITGLLPDGVDSISITKGDGTQQTVGVTDNTTTAHTRDPRSISFVDPDGSQTVSIGG